MNLRKSFMRILLFAIVLSVVSGCQRPRSAPQPPNENAKASQAALAALKDGNSRFASGKLVNPNQGKDRRENTAVEGQYPHSLVLACSDSRVPVESIFDQGIGDVFVVRVAGNITTPEILGSIQYGVHHLHTPLVVVLGHTNCGAVKSAAADGHADGTLGQLLEPLRQVHAQVVADNKDASAARIKDLVTEANVKQGIQEVLRDNPELSGLIKSGDFIIKGAIYDIHSGKVSWLD